MSYLSWADAHSPPCSSASALVSAHCIARKAEHRLQWSQQRHEIGVKFSVFHTVFGVEFFKAGAVWILAAKLPKSDLKIAGDFGCGFFLFLQAKRPENIHQKNPP